MYFRRHVLGSVGEVAVERERTRNVDTREVGFPFSCLDDTDGYIGILGKTVKDPNDLRSILQRRERTDTHRTATTSPAVPPPTTM